MVSDVTRPGGVTVTTDVIAGQPVICLRVDTLVRDVLDAITRPFLDEDPTLENPRHFVLVMLTEYAEAAQRHDTRTMDVIIAELGDLVNIPGLIPSTPITPMDAVHLADALRQAAEESK